MQSLIMSISWIAAGILFSILATYALIHLWKHQGDEVPDPEVEYKHYVKPSDGDSEPYNPEAIYPIIEPDIAKLEKYERVYDHFGYAEQGLTFNDYVRKVECGTWGELAD